MILSELIGAPVVDGGTRVGRVNDVRLVLDATPDQAEPDRTPMPTARLYGLIVGPSTAGSFLGYERSGVSSPWPIAQLLRWRRRDAFLILWRDVGGMSADGVLLRPGARRWSPVLPVGSRWGHRSVS